MKNGADLIASLVGGVTAARVAVAFDLKPFSESLTVAAGETVVFEPPRKGETLVVFSVRIPDGSAATVACADGTLIELSESLIWEKDSDPDGPIASEVLSVTITGGEREDVAWVGGVRAEEIIFKALLDNQEYTDLYARAREFRSKKPKATVSAYFDTDDDTKVTAFVLAALAVSPAMTPSDFLKLAKGAGYIFREIDSKYHYKLRERLFRAERDKREELKNASSATSAGATS